MVGAVLSTSTTSGGQAGQDLPRLLAAFGLVAAGQFPGDHCGMESPFGTIVRRLAPW